ncbi:hypothetical protein BB560_002229 [Smittium megazygosporum]|uniref:Uncharacterized protein n=1 Tax=Smittium megazygosporum TaxID=133381 RepID=A0A2T9ZFF5_9FUNG|nr:hypothetical protein BB560_002229 [Smittium megazygosporum]
MDYSEFHNWDEARKEAYLKPKLIGKYIQTHSGPKPSASADMIVSESDLPNPHRIIPPMSMFPLPDQLYSMKMLLPAVSAVLFESKTIPGKRYQYFIQLVLN